MKICSIENCDGDVLARGWCMKHYNRWHRYGDPEKSVGRGYRPPQPPRTCSIEDCGKPHDSRGYCSMHYERWRRHGDPLQVAVIYGRNGTEDDPIQCNEDNCEYPARTNSLCNRHYRNQMYAKRGECSIEGCTTKWMASGLCGKHYHRQRSWGTTDNPEPVPLRGSCSVDKCTNPIKARDLCGMHLRRWYIYGTTELPSGNGYVRERACRFCKRKLPADQFTIASNACTECLPLHRAELKEKRLVRTREVRKLEKELYEKQQDCCAICGMHKDDAPKGTLHLDHMKIDGVQVIRELLCGYCNPGLGNFRDDPDLMIKAAEYVRRHKYPSATYSTKEHFTQVLPALQFSSYPSVFNRENKPGISEHDPVPQLRMQVRSLASVKCAGEVMKEKSFLPSSLLTSHDEKLSDLPTLSAHAARLLSPQGVLSRAPSEDPL